MSKLKGETHKSEAALTAVPFFFLLCRASVARRIHNSLTNDIRRGHNSHRQGDLYCARSRRRTRALAWSTKVRFGPLFPRSFWIKRHELHIIFGEVGFDGFDGIAQRM